MKINLAILDKDEMYMKRIVAMLTNRFTEQIDIYSFTNQQIAMENLEKDKIDVFLASTEFDVNTQSMSGRCAFAYFTEDNGIQTYMGQKAICKFQKAEILYREIVGLYAEVCTNITVKAAGSDNSKMILFSTPAGGTGNSTVAAACASYLAKQGKHVLYLNLERYGNTQCYFKTEGNGNFSDIIYALKSKKSSIYMKVVSVLRTSRENVKFIEASENAMDMLELNKDDMELLLEEINQIGEIDYIVIDSDFLLDEVEWVNIERSEWIVMVSDGSQQTNKKIKKAVEVLRIMEEQKDMRIIHKIKYCYNRFSSKSGSLIQDNEITSIGGIPKYKNAMTEQIIQEISSKDMFDCFMK